MADKKKVLDYQPSIRVFDRKDDRVLEYQNQYSLPSLLYIMCVCVCVCVRTYMRPWGVPLFVCVCGCVCVLRRFQQLFCHITTVPACYRRDSARVCIAVNTGTDFV